MHTSAFRALLHCTIWSATCSATLKNVSVAVAEVGCYTVQRNLSNFQRFVPREPRDTRTGAPESVVGRIYKEEINASSGKIALQVAGGVLHCATAVASCYDCCEK